MYNMEIPHMRMLGRIKKKHIQFGTRREPRVCALFKIHFKCVADQNYCVYIDVV